ncbi:DUF1137 domain-containing protein [Candidatus Chlamydia sanziniae]|uniref:Lipoprotein n=1 Tax=Candidatus Chlamydia sanziniae TaxID=1806891 RepID=A0A1A9HU67_9CHLA|nr:DUF1137 domain-containing protein [Candidatus Chlamydia sanziniae]ANH78528.1 hypothetical protein Cs308_0357 [Candidatus Chlamydia sanziniae]
MTKFLFHGLLYSLGILLLACGTLIAIIKVDQICDVSCMNKHFEEAPPFLKIKKLGIQKKICSPEHQFFNCHVDKSYIELYLPYPNYSCKEYLSKISGAIQTRDAEKFMKFQGNSGLLNYQDCSLNIYDCRFCLDSSDPASLEDTNASGGMKMLSLSLLRG